MSAPDPRDAKIAALIADRYDLIGHLGRGGFATVYRVRNRRLNRVEALKVLSADLEEPDFADRFRQEARLAASLDHPHIIKIFDYGQAEDLCWFTMQLVEGPTLIRELKQKGPWSEQEAGTLAAAVLDALDYSHKRGIIHRDIKPENILVDSDRRPFLMDFGIAKSDQSVVHTRTGTILGSPAYIAPEQLTGGVGDGRGDIDSLGATIYRMVSNSFPFQDSDPVRMAMKRFTMAPEPLGPKRPGIDPQFEAIVMRSLERDPAARFATAADMAAALRACLAGKPVSLPPLPTLVMVAGEDPGTPRAFSAPFPSAAAASLTAAAGDSLPTIRTAPSIAVADPAGRRPVLWALGGAACLAGAVAIYFAAHSPAPAPAGPATLPTPASAAPASGTASSLRERGPAQTSPEVSEAPSPAPPAVAPAAAIRSPEAVGSSGSDKPADSLPVHAERARAPRPTARPAVREPSHGREETAPVRRAVAPAQTENEAPIEIAAGVAREFANRSVGLSVVVGEDGTVRDARVISPLCPECDRAARAAILRYRFRPAKDAQGQPIESRVAVPVIIPSPD